MRKGRVEEKKGEKEKGGGAEESRVGESRGE